jgi:hypothetical protein
LLKDLSAEATVVGIISKISKLTNIWEKIFLFIPFGILAPKQFYIIWLSNLLTLSGPDEGYKSKGLNRIAKIKGPKQDSQNQRA